MNNLLARCVPIRNEKLNKVPRVSRLVTPQPCLQNNNRGVKREASATRPFPRIRDVRHLALLKELIRSTPDPSRGSEQTSRCLCVRVFFPFNMYHITYHAMYMALYETIRRAVSSESGNFSLKRDALLARGGSEEAG